MINNVKPFPPMMLGESTPVTAEEANRINQHCESLHAEVLRLRANSGEESGWLIELAASEPCSPQYWAGSSLWTPDHLKAIRFARKADAQQAADMMLDGMKIRICEHGWSS